MPYAKYRVYFFISVRIEFSHTKLKKQIDKLKEAGIQKPILIIEHMRKERRNRFIALRIAFIEPGRQLYIPYFMNISEWQSVKRPPIEVLKKSTQIVFIAILMQEKEQILIRDLSEQLQISSMPVHRAIKDLQSIHILKEEGKGTKKLYTRLDKRECWRIGKNFMINPIMKKIYGKPCRDYVHMALSGESALAKLTNINEPAIPIYAIDHHTKENIPFEIMDETAIETTEIEQYEKFFECSRN